MNSNSSTHTDQEDSTLLDHPYQKWLVANFPLLDNNEFSLAYARSVISAIEATDDKALVSSPGAIVDMQISSANPVYGPLKEQAHMQFSELCDASRQANNFGTESRMFLAYLVLSDGFPAFSEMQREFADKGAMLLSELMHETDFRPDIHSAVTGIIGYSPTARASIRLLVLDAFANYFVPAKTQGPSRRELSTVLYDALLLELRRPLSEQSEEFQSKLLTLLTEHPHPATRAVLSTIAAEHNNESLKARAAEWLNRMQDSLCNDWQKVVADQVSGEQFRAECLAQISDYSDERARVNVLFNACKGSKIQNLSDPRLPQLHSLLQNESVRVRLAAAIALSNIYAIEPACETAYAAIHVLADLAINGEDRRFMLDAMQAIKNFETMSESCARKVETEYIAANQKFVFRNAQNTSTS